MTGESDKSFIKRLLFFISFFLFSIPVYSQIESIVYDGYTGMGHSYLNDTITVCCIAEKGPADKSGVQSGDKIIEVDGVQVSGVDLRSWEIANYLYDTEGKDIELTVLRHGEDSSLSFLIQREFNNSQLRECYFEYLVDSSGNWTFEDIITDSINSLFSLPLYKQVIVYSVSEGSIAEELGLMKGDSLISLIDDIDSYKLNNWDRADRIPDYYELGELTEDTSISVWRDSSILNIGIKDIINTERLGIESQFHHDLLQSIIWMKITFHNRIKEDANFLLNFYPDDSVSLFYQDYSGEIFKKSTGSLLSPKKKSLEIGNVFKIILKKNEVQTFYVRLDIKRERVHNLTANNISADYYFKVDRISRLISGILFGMMIIIAVYYLILFFFTKESSYIPFSIFVLCLVIVLLKDSGYAGEFLWLDRRLIMSEGQAIDTFIAALTLTFFNLFGITYLKLREELKIWYRIIVIYLASLWFLIITDGFLSFILHLGYESQVYNVNIVMQSIVLVFSSLILLPPSIIRIIKGFKSSWFFLLGNIVLLGLVFYYLRLGPSIGYSSGSALSIAFSIASIQIGAVIQIILFAFALGQKIRASENANKLAQGRIIEQLKDNEQLKDKVNRELETKVRERTKEINGQKEEIEAQRDEIEAQRDEVEAQRDEVEAQRDQLKDHRDVLVTQKSEIIDSINYAQRIQSAMLPPEVYITELLNENFILHKPRDIVSGDFYWIKQVKQYIILLAADCTGHGVPGALMSMLGISYLNEIVERREITQANQILNELRKQIKFSLRQHGQPDEAKDGIDIALCVLDLRNMMMQYSGANSPLYLIRDVDDVPELKEIKADKMPVGFYQGKDKTFTNHDIQLEIGDTFYMFSDGFIDQKGGKDNKKFMSKNFKNLLLEIHDHPMYDQKAILDKTLSDWMGVNSQMDDILVMGVRV